MTKWIILKYKQYNIVYDERKYYRRTIIVLIRINHRKKKWKLKFSEEKIVNGISRAGTPFMLAKNISKSITKKLAENPPIENYIYSSKIREYVAEE